MPRRIAWALAFGVAATALVWVGWPGAAANPATPMNRTDVVATVLLLAALPWAVCRAFGPGASGWLARIVRLGGYASVIGLVLVKVGVERSEYASPAGRPLLAGVWTGEVVFVAVLAVYLTGLLAVTARRPPAAPAALAAGIAAGVAAGLVMYALPPVGSPLHVATRGLMVLYDAARVLALLLALGVIIAAGLLAARRAKGRGQGGALPLADARARQGVWAGLCAGVAAALVASLLGICTIALRPQEAHRLVWTLPNRDLPLSTGYQFGTGVTGSAAGHLPHYGNRLTMGLRGHPAPSPVYEFEVAVTDSAAGHLLVLLFFPLLGAGLGAWGGLYGAGQPHRRPGGGGGGGGEPPDLVPPEPSGGAHAGEEHLPPILRGGYLRELPATGELSPAPEDEHAPRQPVGGWG